MYSDIEISCGVDSGVVKGHRLLLAAVSPFLREVFLADEFQFCDHQQFSLFLPDVSSGCLKKDFLKNE